MEQKQYLMILSLLHDTEEDSKMPKEMEIELIAEKAVNYIKYKLREGKVTDFEYKMILSKINMLLSEEIYGLIKTDYNEFL